jgi:elongation factor Tu
VKSVVTSVETFGKTMAAPGRRQRGAAAARRRPSPGAARPGARRTRQPAAHQRFTPHLHLLSAAEGGRRTPVRSGYRPQFYVRTTDVSGVLDLGQPGPGQRRPRPRQARPCQGTVQVTVELGKPVALDPGQTFAIREGGRTVGAGTVTALLD